MTSPWNKALHIKTFFDSNKIQHPIWRPPPSFLPLVSEKEAYPCAVGSPESGANFGSCPASSCYKLRALYFLRLYMCYLQEFASKLLTHTTHIVHITLHPSHTVLYMFYCIHLIHAHRMAPHEENKSRILHPDFFKAHFTYLGRVDIFEVYELLLLIGE